MGITKEHRYYANVTTGEMIYNLLSRRYEWFEERYKPWFFFIVAVNYIVDDKQDYFFEAHSYNPYGTDIRFFNVQKSLEIYFPYQIHLKHHHSPRMFFDLYNEYSGFSIYEGELIENKYTKTFISVANKKDVSFFRRLMF